MQRRFIALAAIIVTCGLGSALTASAALPKKGAEYQGVIKSTPFEMRVLLGVSATGKKLRFTYACGTGRAPTIVFGVPIDATGHFKMTGSLVVWKMAGRFISPTRAFVSLNSIACGGSKGSTTLTLK
jgi:hypothetical protein